MSCVVSLLHIECVITQQIINPVKWYHDFLSVKQKLNFSFGIIDTEETTSVISNLKNKSWFGHDLISNKLVILIKSVIVKTLTLIINQMLSTGIFPDAMKLSKVILK